MMTGGEIRNLRPRRYQEELLAQAQSENVIAALDTGTGKTLISLLLMKWMASQPSSNGKVIIFLVPKIALVEQQADFIAEHSSFKVVKLHGAIDVELFDQQAWQKRFESFDVFVLTAQIFLNILTHSRWNIDKVSLMVFDECHHARKNHPYNGIMREYHQVAVKKRPKIFGMTASPVWGTRDSMAALVALEANMDAKVVSVQTHFRELQDHSNKPAELVHQYPPSYDLDHYPSPSLYHCLQHIDPTVWKELNIPWAQIEVRYSSTMANLGPYSATDYLHQEIQRYLARSISEVKQSKTLRWDTDDVAGAPSTTVDVAITQLQEFTDAYAPFFDQTTPINLDLCSAKVSALTDLLLSYYSDNFQGIIFVEQRQIASCLSHLLPNIPALKGKITCDYLVGQGTNTEGVLSIPSSTNVAAVKGFRERSFNLLIATSVAEEGLDFPTCDLVIRFDGIQHLVAYVQSRGRARSKASTFIIMIQSDDKVSLERYTKLRDGEVGLKDSYRNRRIEADTKTDTDDIDPKDLQLRQRFVVPSTGAVLNYDNAMNLLNYLCALIPRDEYTPVLSPQYTGDFQATLSLPSALALTPVYLNYTGPIKRTKREAKRAVAYLAVWRLHSIGVFDDYLLPISRTKRSLHDLNGQPIVESGVPHLMNTYVRSPWTMHTTQLWLHRLSINGRCVGGLLTGTSLPPVHIKLRGDDVETSTGQRISSIGTEPGQAMRALLEFTTLGIWYRVTLKPTSLPTGLCFVPLTSSGNVDFAAVERLLNNPNGLADWTTLTAQDYEHLLVITRHERTRLLRFQLLHNDLTPLSKPPPGAREAEFDTYHGYFVNRWTRKTFTAEVSTVGPMIDAVVLPRSCDGSYRLNAHSTTTERILTAQNGLRLPRDSCRWIPLSSDMCHGFEVLPSLCRTITDVYRARCARAELGLPPILDDLLIEALTTPSANVGHNNQRMETLGDAVLELCVTVHLFHRYPQRHEGQLTILRQGVISNRYLLSRAKDIGLEHFVINEAFGVQKWRFTEPTDPLTSFNQANRRTPANIPRRSLQDCIEAILAASFITGGIDMALHTGTSFGLPFGGTVPWPRRFGRTCGNSPVSPLFRDLQAQLGYVFHCNEHILEAITHPTHAIVTGGSSYQRYEFLGDAILNIVVVRYLYDKFPNATSEQLSLPRTKAVCATALAWTAVTRLNLHRILLTNSFELLTAVDRCVQRLGTISAVDIVNHGWRYDPPKALSDIFESIIGAVFLDSGCNYERTAAVAEFLLEDILNEITPNAPKDPVSSLLEWTAQSGCRIVTFEKQMKAATSQEGFVVKVHGTVVAGPIIAKSLAVARFAAAERALSILKDDGHEKSLGKLCTCHSAMDVDNEPLSENLGEDGSDFEEYDEVYQMLTEGF